MGQRANYVIIKDGQANAYFDNWGALGCAFILADGPEAATKAAEETEPTDELLDWAFAEGGFLIDYDQQKLIAFGLLDALDEEFDEEFDDDTEDEDNEGEELTEYSSLDQWKTHLESIAGNWSGWLLTWDERGADAFALHLKQRGISNIKTQEASHPEYIEHYERQA
ncbi:hypothetical protein [Methylomagnum sp.]